MSIQVAKLERWSGLIDLGLIFIGAASWSVPITGLCLLLLLLRRWSLLGQGLLLLLGLDYAPLWLLLLAPSTAAADAPAEITSSQSTVDEPIATVAEPIATDEQTALQPIAEPSNEGNEALIIAAKVEALAAVIMESQRASFKNGIVAETRAIKAIFGCAETSNPSSEYQQIKRLLAAEKAKLGQQKAKNELVTINKDGRAIRQDEDGRIYIASADGSRTYLVPESTN